jgi:hypothetical protein
MSTALAQRQDILPDAASWKTMLEMAGQLVQSGLLPKGIDKPAAALAIIQKGRELGIPPMYALSNIGIINGKPVVGAEVMLAMVYRDHGDQAIQFEETSAERCSVVYKRKSWAQYRTFEWTVEDAKKAGLTGKGGPWSQYPAAMLRARCISAVARLAFPDSLGGMYTPEELGAEVTVTDDGAIEVVQAPAPVVTIVPNAGDIASMPVEPAGPSDRGRLEARHRQLGQMAIAKNHPKAGAINATPPESLTDAQLLRSIKRLEELFPDVPAETEQEAAF